MDELFRFAVLRSSGSPAISTATGEHPSAAADSVFQQSLVAAKEGAAPRKTMEGLARDHMQSDGFPKNIEDYAYGRQLQDLLATKSDIENNLDSSEPDVFEDEATHTTNDQDLDAEVEDAVAAAEEDAALSADVAKAADALVALTIVGDTSPAVAAATAVLRGAALVSALRRNPSTSAPDIASIVATSVVLPSSIFPLPSPFVDGASTRAAATEKEYVRAAHHAEANQKARQAAINKLRSIDRATSALQGALGRRPTNIEARVEPASALNSDSGRGTSSGGGLQMLTRRGAHGVMEAPTVRLTAKPFTAQSLHLDASTIETLSSTGLDPRAFSSEHAFALLRQSGTQLRMAIRGLADRPAVNYRKFNFYYAPGSSEPVPQSGADDEPAPPHLSSLHGAIEQLTTADLMLVRQTLKHYEGGEIAHIENVLAGETREHRTKRTSTVNEFTETETDTTTEEERDQQTTDRFELKRESEKTIQEDSELRAGVALSARYGSVLEVNTNVSGSLSQHKEESAKQSATFSKDVTTRATSKISEKVRKLQSRRVIEKYIEANLHSFTSPEKNVCGVYQWVNKVYQAQVLNYGQRAMYNVVIPEPAAFWLDAYQQRDATVAIRPEPFLLSPGQISLEPGDYLCDDDHNPVDLEGSPLPSGAKVIPSDYLFYAARYQASGVKPPPALDIQVSKSVSAKVQGGGGDASANADTKELSIPIPAGYLAVGVFLTGSWKSDSLEHWENGEHTLAVLVGHVGLGFSNPTYGWQGPELDLRANSTYAAVADLGVANELGIAINTWNITDYALTVNVICKATPEALAQWQIDTYNAIMQGYLKLQADYDEKRNEAQNQAFSMRTFNTNPGMNKKIIAEEVKKSCISVMSKQYFGWIGAITNAIPDGPHVYPQPDLDKLDPRASYIQFIEQAFEWEHMTYFFYSYFWGRKSGWYDKSYLDNSDPAFFDFLKAGAARCVIPVRPGFEEAVAHFIDTKFLWNENNNSALSPGLMAIIDEIRASADVNGEPPTPVGDPWEVRVPTTLIRLRDDATLPVWIPDPAAKSPTDAWLPAKWDAATKTYVADFNS